MQVAVQTLVVRAPLKTLVYLLWTLIFPLPHPRETRVKDKKDDPPLPPTSVLHLPAVTVHRIVFQVCIGCNQGWHIRWVAKKHAYYTTYNM